LYKGIKTNAHTLIPEIVEVDFEVRKSEWTEGDWIYITKGAVTGYESANVRELVGDYSKRSVFSTWIANAGTLNEYHRLEIPMSEIIKYLEDQKLIETKREYGYIKEVVWG